MGAPGLAVETWETMNLNASTLRQPKPIGLPHPRRVLVFAARVGDHEPTQQPILHAASISSVSGLRGRHARLAIHPDESPALQNSALRQSSESPRLQPRRKIPMRFRPPVSLKITILVSTASRSISTLSMCANVSANSRACAYLRAAARPFAPGPSIQRQQARPPVAFRHPVPCGKAEPGPSTLPTRSTSTPPARPSPFDRQKHHVSNPRVSAFTSTPSAIAALNISRPIQVCRQLALFCRRPKSPPTPQPVCRLRRPGWQYSQSQQPVARAKPLPARRLPVSICFQSSNSRWASIALTSSRRIQPSSPSPNPNVRRDSAITSCPGCVCSRMAT